MEEIEEAAELRLKLGLDEEIEDEDEVLEPELGVVEPVESDSPTE